MDRILDWHEWTELARRADSAFLDGGGVTAVVELDPDLAAAAGFRRASNRAAVEGGPARVSADALRRRCERHT